MRLLPLQSKGDVYRQLDSVVAVLHVLLIVVGNLLGAAFCYQERRRQRALLLEEAPTKAPQQNLQVKSASGVRSHHSGINSDRYTSTERAVGGMPRGASLM